MEYPKLEWKPLVNKTKEELSQYIHTHGGDVIVFLRCRYRGQEEWEYLTECCIPVWWNHTDIEWFSDWYEGQQDVEYLAVCFI